MKAMAEIDGGFSTVQLDRRSLRPLYAETVEDRRGAFESMASDARPGVRLGNVIEDGKVVDELVLGHGSTLAGIAVQAAFQTTICTDLCRIRGPDFGGYEEKTP